MPEGDGWRLLLLHLYEDTICRRSASANSFQSTGHGFPKCQQRCRSPSLQSRAYGFRHPGCCLCCRVCGKSRHRQTQHRWETDERRTARFPKHGWAVCCPPLSLGSCTLAVPSPLSGTGSFIRAEQPAGLTRCSCLCTAVPRRGSSHGRSQLWLGCRVWGGQRGRSAEETQFVRLLEGRSWNKA